MILWEQFALCLKKGCSTPLRCFVAPSGLERRQARLEEIAYSLVTACPINQSEEQRSVIFEARSDGTDETEGELFSTDYERG
jgi:hypothetical protein